MAWRIMLDSAAFGDDAGFDDFEDDAEFDFEGL